MDDLAGLQEVTGFGRLGIMTIRKPGRYPFSTPMHRMAIVLPAFRPVTQKINFSSSAVL